MDVAQISVLASSLVAFGALISQGLAGRGQRKHESRLAYEQRVWDRKSDALFRCIGAAREVTDALGAGVQNRGPAPEHRHLLKVWERAGYRPAVRIVEALHRLTQEIADAGPVIESFGSKQVRADLLAVRAEMRGVYYEYVWLADITAARMEKEQLIEEQDFADASHARDRETEALKGLSDSLTVPAGLEERLLTFIESARQSIRSD